MGRSLIEELRYLLDVARIEIPRVEQLEQHVSRGPGQRSFSPRVNAGHRGGAGQPASVKLADCAVSEIWIDYEQGFGGCEATLFVRSGVLDELSDLVGEWQTRRRNMEVDVVAGVALARAREIELEVKHRHRRIETITVCFARLRGKYCNVTVPPHVTSLGDELRAVLALADRNIAVDAAAVERRLVSRGLAITSRPPWWTEAVGRDERYAELTNSTAYGLRFFDVSGWGCEVVLYTQYGMLADIEQVVGRTDPYGATFDDFSGRTSSGVRCAIGNFDVEVSAQHVDGHVVSVRVVFPSQPRRIEDAPEEPTPPAGPPPSEPYRPSRRDVAVLAVRMLETGRVVHHEIDRTFLLGSSPDCDIVVPWNDHRTPREEISIRIAVAPGRLQIIETSGSFELDDRPIDFPGCLSIGSRLTAGKSLEITVVQLPS